MNKAIFRTAGLADCHMAAILFAAYATASEGCSVSVVEMRTND